MASRHTALANACAAYIHARGGMATRLQSGKVRVGKHWVQMSNAGWCDVIGVLPGGQMIGVEVKVGRDVVRPSQALVHAHLRRLGAIVVVARSVLDVERALPVP